MGAMDEGRVNTKGTCLMGIAWDTMAFNGFTMTLG